MVSRKGLWLNYSLWDLLSPGSMSHLWSLGFMLGVSSMLQIGSGIILSSTYFAGSGYESVISSTRELDYGEISRFFHSNLVTVIFLGLYIHVFRGVFYKSFFLLPVWGMGVLIMLGFILTSFLGYSLPWSQMSFWAATVITNLVAATPVVGESVLSVLLGGFSVSVITLNRFYSFHFFLPFVILALIAVHIMSLHLIHSQSPLELKTEGVKFSPLFIWKDTVLFMLFFFLLLVAVGGSPFFFLESDMFFPANPLAAPEHIVPEWYFLPFYAVLRAVPSKLGGVILMIAVFVLLWGMSLSSGSKGVFFLSRLGLMTICGVMLFMWSLLFWIGGLPVIYPFDSVGGAVTCSFFLTLTLFILVIG